MKIETVKFYSRLAGMALLFGAVNLVMYSFLPLEFIRKYSRFESDLSLFLMLLIIVSFGLVPASLFSIVFRRYDRKGVERADRKRLFLKGLGPGFFSSIFLGIFCLEGFGQTNFGAVGGAILSFLILVVPSCMILGGITRSIVPERRFLSFIIAVMVFIGGMSGFLFLKAFIHQFFSWRTFTG
jgi:hypothetical protein